MLRADELTVVHHDDTVTGSPTCATRWAGGACGWSWPSGEEILFPQHDVLTTHARTATPPTAARTEMPGAPMRLAA